MPSQIYENSNNEDKEVHVKLSLSLKYKQVTIFYNYSVKISWQGMMTNDNEDSQAFKHNKSMFALKLDPLNIFVLSL